MKKARKKHEPLTGTERYERWSRKLEKAGGRRVTAHVGPEASKALNKLLLADANESVSSILSRALIVLGRLGPMAKGADLHARPSNYGKGPTAY